MVTLALIGALLGACSLLTGGRSQAGEFFSGTALELAEAIESRDESRTEELIAAGADVEATGADDITMLQWAVRTRNPQGVTSLLEAGADPDRTGYYGNAALHMAVYDIRLVEALLAAGADPDVQNPHTRLTPLTEVCLSGNPDTFEALIAAGADVSHESSNGGVPIHTCARTNRGGLILRMLELGADPTAATSAGTTFQEYYFGYDVEVLNDRSLDERRQIVAWLEANGYELVPEAEQFRDR